MTRQDMRKAPSAFVPCRACGKPVYVGARRCPNCRAPTSWPNRLRQMSFRFLIAALFAVMIVDIVLYGWPDQSKPAAAKLPLASGLPAPTVPATPPATVSRLPQVQANTPRRAAKAAKVVDRQTVAALRQPYTQRASSFTVRGKLIAPGMTADSLFEVVGERDMLDQTTERDPGNPPNLKFVKHFRVDNQDFVIELHKPGPAAPYMVTQILIERTDDRAGTNK